MLKKKIKPSIIEGCEIDLTEIFASINRYEEKEIYMKKLFLIFICLVMMSMAHAESIWSLPGTKQIVAEISDFNSLKETRNRQNLYHHSNSDDLLFLGTDRWAVNFNINNMITFSPDDTVSVYFSVNALSIFMPQAAENVTIALHDNLLPQNPVSVTQPGIVLFSTTTSLSSGWNTIPTGEDIPVENCWIVLGFSNFATDIGVSASNGTGNHSYFFDRFNSSSGTFRNMGSNGFQADLLFSLVGSFDIPVIILEFLEYNIPTFVNPEEPFFPSFTIRNNSTISIKDVRINVEVRNLKTETIFIISEMSPGQTISSDMVDFEGIELPEGFTQYQVFLQMNCDPQGEKFLERTVSAQINVFEHERKKTLVEIFALSNDPFTSQINEYILNEIDPDTIDVLYHFANSIDGFYTWAAYQRGMQYGHQGFQHVYFNGSLSSRNFTDPAFFDKFNDSYSSSSTDKTFITCNEFIAYVAEEIYLFIDISLFNINTSLLSAFQNDIILNVAILQPVTLNEKNIKIVSQYITNGTMGLSLNFIPSESPIKYEGFIPLYNINLLHGNELNDLELIFWIQRKATNEIFYHDVFSLSTVEFPENIGGEDKVPEIVLYPNPVKQNDVLNISFLNSKEQKDSRGWP